MQISVKKIITEPMTPSGVFENLLVLRGLASQGDQYNFLHPQPLSMTRLIKETGLSDKTLSEIKNILDQHLASGHDIVVFGDYDTDGITATAVLWQALVKYSAGSKSRLLPFIPDRHRHGYGLSVKAVEEILAGEAFKTTKFSDFSPKLIITVDNGIVANLAVSQLREHKIDVIITDHHEIDVLPNANIILHTKVTSGAGIAWILAYYLLNSDQFSTDLIELATIGIVADMMPLTGLNRDIVVTGLSSLNLTKRPGLKALYQVSNLKDGVVTAYTIGYLISPRINAAGRLADPYDALRLLCATNQATASQLAGKINDHNLERQTMTDLAIAQAQKESFSHKVVVVKGDYHEGVIGLVAGKLTELSGKPAIVMSVKENEIKASARSVPGVNITELLRSLKVPFLSLGGHSQAAGFSLSKDKLTEFLSELESLGDAVILDEFLEKKIHADLEIMGSHVSLQLAKMIASLEPFGLGNPKPKFVLRNLTVLEDKALGAGGKHHKLTLESSGQTFDLLMFNSTMAHPLKNIQTLIATMDVNIWNNRESVQLISSHVEL